MTMNKLQLAVLYAYSRGYKVSSNGTKVTGIRTSSLKLNIGRAGYYYFCVHPIIDNKRDKVLVKVHRLQAYQKYGEEIFKKGIQVRHLNNNKLDNSWNNIAIGTPSENMKDSPYVGERIRKHSLRAGLMRSPLSEQDVLEIRKRVREGKYGTYQKLAEEYGLKSKSTICGIVKRNNWRHI